MKKNAESKNDREALRGKGFTLRRWTWCQVFVPLITRDKLWRQTDNDDDDDDKKEKGRDIWEKRWVEGKKSGSLCCQQNWSTLLTHPINKQKALLLK